MKKKESGLLLHDIKAIDDARNRFRQQEYRKRLKRTASAEEKERLAEANRKRVAAFRERKRLEAKRIEASDKGLPDRAFSGYISGAAMAEIDKHAKQMKVTKSQVIEMAIEIARLAMHQWYWRRDDNGNLIRGDRGDDPSPYMKAKKTLKIRNRQERKKDPKLFSA